MLKQLFYHGPSFTTLYTDYALKGKIDEKAAIKASGEIHINAPIDKVWNVLVNLSSWPHFDPNFSDVKLESTVSVGAKASFKIKGFPIQGTFAVVRSNQELTWVGTSLWTKAIDRHIVEAISNKTTRLYLEESLSGVFVPLMFTSARLLHQHQGWLNAIKTYVETAQQTVS
jgi:hypothetical protein